MSKGTPKIKFKEYKHKQTNGYIENVILAYIDVTSEMKEILGNIIKNAIIKIETYHEAYGTIDEWKESVKRNQYDINKEHIQVDGTVLYITLTNGSIVEFFTSEWGHIQKLKNTPEVLKI